MKIKVFVSSLGAYNEGVLTGFWTSLPVENVQKDIIDLIDGAVGDEYFISDYEAPFKIDSYANLNILNQLALALSDDNISSILDLYWNVIENVNDESDISIPRVVNFDDEDDLNAFFEFCGDDTPYKVVKDLGPNFNLTDEFLYYDNATGINTMSNFAFVDMVEHHRRDLIVEYCHQNNITSGDYE